jgi:hypothetical protein
MTTNLRDHFAGLAMQSILSRHADHRDEFVAERAYRVADVMLAIRGTPRHSRYDTSILPPPMEEPAEPPAPHSDTDPTQGVLGAFIRMTPEERRKAVQSAGGLPTYEKPEEHPHNNGVAGEGEEES